MELSPPGNATGTVVPDNITAEHASPYEKLANNEVRLLEFLPSNDTATICCQLTTRLLRSNTQYVSVSYTWGQPDRDCHIQLNGQKFQVRKNLLRFLQEISRSRPYQGVLFWIDALCIDQGNAQERSEQVQLMAEIYKGADHVLVWLGPSYADSDLAMKALNRDIKYWQRHMKMEKVFWRPEGAAIRRLCERAYWTRLWVLQELVNAKSATLMCGGKSIAWKAFVNFCELAEICQLERKNESFERVAFKSSPALSMMRQVQQTAGNMTTLFDLLLSSRLLACSEPRDKVYALLGVARSGQHFITIDYNVDLVHLSNAVLRGHHFARPPKTIEEVSQQCHDLSDIVGMDIVNFDGVRISETAPKLRKFQVQLPLFARDTKINLWWIDHYEHEMIRQIWLANHTQKDMDAILFAAVASGDMRVIKMLLNIEAYNNVPARVNLNCRGEAGRRPIIEAARLGHAEIVKLLLEHGDSNMIDQVDDDGFNAMYHAIVNGNEQVMRVLILNTEVNINSGCCKAKPTPLLYLAIENRHTDIVKLLVDKPETDVNLRWGYYDHPITPAIRSGSLPMVEALMSRNDVRWSQTTPLHTAARLGDVHILQHILNNNLVDINARDHKKQTALFVAMAEWRVQIAVILLSNSSLDVNAEDQNGNTALHWAVRHQNEIIQDHLLTHKDLDFNIRNNAGHTALYDAVTYENERMQEEILRSGKVDLKGVEVAIVRGLGEKAYMEYCEECARQGVQVGWGRAMRFLGGGATGR